MKTLEDAIMTATTYHKGQTDKSGEPYILHCIRVMMKMATPSAKMVAILHDIAEDTSMSVEKLRHFGFPYEVCIAVDALTHKGSQTYMEYVAACSHNILAKQVKIADLQDHLEQNAITHVLKAIQVEHYEEALKLLTQ